MINVRDYGAVGDGIADDTEAIQRAADAAQNSPDTRTVYLPAGIYRLTTTERSLFGLLRSLFRSSKD